MPTSSEPGAKGREALARQTQFLNVVWRDEATMKFREHLRLAPLGEELVPLGEALNRVLARDVVAEIDVPGFDRLSGLMVMVGCSFVIALAIQKTRIWVFFGGSIEQLLLLAAGVFALLKWGSYMLFRQKEEPKSDPPPFPRL